MRPIGLYFVLLIAALPLRAHIFSIPFPDDLLGKATVVCNGTVLDVSKSTEQVTVTRIYPPAVCDVFVARIKILASFKGDAKGEIELRYPRVARVQPGVALNDDSIHYDLKPGNRYRFYLIPKADGKTYVTVLDMQYDDLWTVESLDPNEPDSSPPLLQKEALQLATAYLNKIRPGTTCEFQPSRDYSLSASLKNTGFVPNVWGFNLWYFQPPKNKRWTVPDATIYVRGDRSIDSISWVAALPPLKPEQITPADIGKFVRLDVARVGNRYVRGSIASVTKQKIRLKDAHNEQDGSLTDVGYFKRDLNTAWLLEPAPK